MKKKDFVDLKTKEIKDLEKLVAEKRNKAKLGSTKNLRREIAKILTLIREKEIALELEAK